MGSVQSNPLGEVALLARIDQSIAGASSIGLGNSSMNDSDTNGEHTGWVWLQDKSAVFVKKGVPNFEFQIQARVLQVFLSSTFTDTKIERDALIQRVFPTIRELCHAHGFEFRIVDMRWGIRDESTRDHLTSEICAYQIAKCRQSSCSLNFVSLLSHKYGFRPLPRVITTIEFEEIGKAATRQGVSDLLQKVYRENTNRCPVVVELVSKDSLDQLVQAFQQHQQHQQHVSSPPDANNSAHAQLNMTDLKMSPYLLLSLLFREAVSLSSLPIPRKQVLTQSITEDEIQRGFLFDSSQNAAWFHRIFSDAPWQSTSSASPPATKLESRFVDSDPIHGTTLTDEQSRLENLKQKMNQAFASNANTLFPFPIRWDSTNGIDCTNVPDHKEYLDRFCSAVTTLLATSVTTASAALKDSHPLIAEVAHHITLGRAKQIHVVGQAEAIRVVMAYLERPKPIVRSTNILPLIILAPSGCGKTSLMAKCASLCEDQSTILRFIGTSPRSSHIRDLLFFLCWQLSTVLSRADLPSNANHSPEAGSWIAPPPPRSYRELVELFQSLLAQVSQREGSHFGAGVTVFLDSFDQLSDQDRGRNEPIWLSSKLHENARMVISCATDGMFGPDCVAELRRRGLVAPDGSNVLQLKPLDAEDQRVMMQSMLTATRDCLLTGDYTTTLEPSQHAALTTACLQCPIPLYISLAVEEARDWKSFQTPTPSLPASVPELISEFFHRLEIRHGVLFVSHAFRAISASKSGLSNAEIEDILSLNDDVLNDVFQYWEPPVRRLPPMLWLRVLGDVGEKMVERMAEGRIVLAWYHRQFAETCIERYFGGNEPSLNAAGNTSAVAAKWKETRSHLADYFEGTWAELPKPYVDKNGKNLNALRMVPRQPLVYQHPGDAERSNSVTEFDGGSNNSNQQQRQLNLRRLSELVHQCIHSGQTLRALEHSCSLVYIDTKIEAGMLSDALQELVTLEDLCKSFSTATTTTTTLANTNATTTLASERVHNFRSFVSRNQHVLERAGAHRLQVLLQQALNEPSTAPVYIQARTLLSRRFSVIPQQPANATGAKSRKGGGAQQTTPITPQSFLGWVNKPQHQDVCETSVDVGHGSAVRCCSFGFTGDLVLSGNSDGALRLWHCVSGTLACTLREHTEEVSTCQFVSGICGPAGEGDDVFVSGSSDRNVLVWSVVARSSFKKLTGCTDGVTCLSASRGFDSSQLIVVAGSFDKVVRVWVTKLPTLNTTMSAVSEPSFELSGHTDKLTSVCLLVGNTSINDSRVVSADKSMLRVWNIQKSECISKISTVPGIACIVKAPQLGDHTIATGCTDGTIRIWNISNIRRGSIANLEGHNDSVNNLAIFGNLLVSGGDYNDRCVRVWELDKTKPELVNRKVTLTGHSSRVYGVSLSPNMPMAASVGWDNTLRIWNLESALSTQFAAPHHNAEITSLVFDKGNKCTTESAQQHKLVSTASDGTVHTWALASSASESNVPTLQLMHSFQHPKHSAATCCAIVYGTKKLPKAKQQHHHNSNINNTITTATNEDNDQGASQVRKEREDSQNNISNNSNNTNVDECSDNEVVGVVVVGFEDGFVSATDLQTGKQIIGDTIHKGRVWNICGCERWREGISFLSAGADNTLIVHHVVFEKQNRVRLMQQRFIGHLSAVTGCAFGLRKPSSNTNTNTTNTTNTNINTNVSTNGKDEFNGTSAREPIAVSCGGDGMLRIWNPETGACFQKVQGASGGMWKVALTPNADLVACACHDRKVRVYNTYTGEPYATLTGLSAQVTHCHFVNSRILVASGRGREIKVWNIQDRVTIANLFGHASGIRSLVHCGVDETRDFENKKIQSIVLVSVSADQTLRVWNVPTDPAGSGTDLTGMVSTNISCQQIFCGDFSVVEASHEGMVVCGARDGRLLVLDNVLHSSVTV